jgi:hypothetical protein
VRLTAVSSLALIVALLIVGSANAQTAATISIEPDGVIVGGGAGALVFLVVECTLDPGDELLEGFVSLSQQSAAGMGALNPRCDGKARRTTVRVAASGGSFQPGGAFASAFLLFLDPETGTTFQAQSSRAITLRGPTL